MKYVPFLETYVKIISDFEFLYLMTSLKFKFIVFYLSGNRKFFKPNN